ncbi:MAG TPA: 3-phosphoshikimate 1-carboxyvinyltransferase, partial [Bacteroidales bacterium]|nr:3-phosphoshikimate 1-carboxyvinyltransferase [Bacteroidales bacterium]
MQTIIKASIIKSGILKIPASKSISNRVLIIHALSKSRFSPENLSDCDDTQVMVHALNDNKETIDIKAAGTAMRFLTAYYSIMQGDKTITGTERMKHRPIKILVDALRILGAQIEYTEEEGFPPLHIKGEVLSSKDLTLCGNISSQFISAVLMIGPMLKNGLNINLTGQIISRPYINLTLKIMNDFGAKACWTKCDKIRILPQPYVPKPIRIENDWSAASYWYEIVALSRQKDLTVKMPDLFRESYQGDCIVAKLFQKLGVITEYSIEDGVPYVTLHKTEDDAVPQLSYDFINEPDLAQTFVVTCIMMGIPFRFSGLQSLKVKETDRIQALIKECTKLGYVLTEKENSTLIWNEEYCEKQAYPIIDTYED